MTPVLITIDSRVAVATDEKSERERDGAPPINFAFFCVSSNRNGDNNSMAI